MLLLDLDVDCLERIVRLIKDHVAKSRQSHRTILRHFATLARLAATCKTMRSLAHDAEETAAMRRCDKAALLDIRAEDEKPAVAALARRWRDKQTCNLFTAMVCSPSVVALCPERCCLQRRCKTMLGLRELRNASGTMRAVHSSSLATAFVPESRGEGVFALEAVERPPGADAVAANGGVLWTSVRCVLYDAQGVARGRSEPLLGGRATNVDLIGRVSPVSSTRPPLYQEAGSAPSWTDAVTRMEAVDDFTCVIGIAQRAVLVLRVDPLSGAFEVESVETDPGVWCHSSHCVLWDGDEPVLAMVQREAEPDDLLSQGYVLSLLSLGSARWRRDVRLTAPHVLSLAADQAMGRWVAPVCVARGTDANVAVVVMCTGTGQDRRQLCPLRVRLRGGATRASRGGWVYLAGDDRRAVCVPVHGKGVLAVTTRGVTMMLGTVQTVLFACCVDDADMQALCAMDLANPHMWAAVTPSLTDALFHGRSGSVWHLNFKTTTGSNVSLHASFDVTRGARLQFLHDGTAALQLSQGTILLSSDCAAHLRRVCQSGVQTPCRSLMLHA